MDEYFGFARRLLDLGLARSVPPYTAGERYDLVTVLTDDIPFYLELARGCGGRVLELGCGTGRILLPLLDAGIDPVGLDLSPAMLARAHAKLRAAGHSPLLVQGDFRRFKLDTRFSLCLMPYCSLIYLYDDDDRRRTFASVYEHLEPGGLFAFDFDAEICRLGDSRPWLGLQAVEPDSGAVLVQTVQMRGLHQRLRLMNIITYRHIGSDTTITVEAAREATCSARHLQELLIETGFEVRGIYRDYAFNPYDGGELGVALASRPA